MKNWMKKKTDATLGIVEKGWVLVVLLLILGGDGWLMWLPFGSLIGVSSVHSCPISVWDTMFSHISHIHQRIGGRSGLPVPIYLLRCTSPRSSQFWVASHDILVLVGNDREFHHNSFWYISSARFEGHKMLFLCVGFAVPSTVGSLLLDDVARNWESIQSPLTKILTGFAFNQEMSTGATDHSLIPIKKAFWVLHFWNCFA